MVQRRRRLPITARTNSTKSVHLHTEPWMKLVMVSFPFQQGWRSVFFWRRLSLSTFSPAFPSFLPQSEINGSPCEVERKSATDGGKCKLLHLKKGRRWSLTASVSRAASWLYFPERCRSGAWFTLDVVRMSGSTARGMIVVLRRFDEVLLTWINDWTHPPPKTQIQSITHDFWQFYRAINASAKCESITAEHLLSVVLVNDMLMKAFK